MCRVELAQLLTNEIEIVLHICPETHVVGRHGFERCPVVIPRFSPSPGVRGAGPFVDEDADRGGIGRPSKTDLCKAAD